VCHPVAPSKAVSAASDYTHSKIESPPRATPHNPRRPSPTHAQVPLTPPPPPSMHARLAPPPPDPGRLEVLPSSRPILFRPPFRRIVPPSHSWPHDGQWVLMRSRPTKRREIPSATAFMLPPRETTLPLPPTARVCAQHPTDRGLVPPPSPSFATPPADLATQGAPTPQHRAAVRRRAHRAQAHARV
jgi:hypothetical protein